MCWGVWETMANQKKTHGFTNQKTTRITRCKKQEKLTRKKIIK